MNKDPRQDAKGLVKAVKFIARLTADPKKFADFLDRLPKQSRKEVERHLTSLFQHLSALNRYDFRIDGTQARCGAESPGKGYVCHKIREHGGSHEAEAGSGGTVRWDE